MIIALVILAVVLIIAAFFAGSIYRKLKDRIQELEEKVVEDSDDTPSIIDTSPPAVFQRAHDSNRDDSESQIFHVKTPKQIQQEKDDKTNEYLDRFTNG
jgi:hypothetical protein